MTDFYLWATGRCSQKEYCRSEIAQKLRTKGATPDEIESLLARLESERYIDETRYARAFVSDKFRFDHWGRITDDDYRASLSDFIASRRRTTKGDTPYAINQKIARSAISRGFEPHLVFDALRVENDADF